ncbi:MAG: hypothetical protein KZQ79_11855, partial [Candidatus Thiodiazotropha sp. (ex Lucinoma borealis)]|nr:hypothetical protein [Candidatus Thiodiazotropha sp. (ex Lucinoma borealis)]
LYRDVIYEEYKKLVNNACNLVFHSYTTAQQNQISGGLSLNEHEQSHIHSIRLSVEGVITPYDL